MSKKRRIVLFISALVMIICMQVSVHAASNSNPLKNMPTESVSIAGAVTGEGCNFFTPQYKSNFKMKATSSNKKVATVKVYDFQGTDGYSKGYLVTRKGYGTTNIKVTVTIGKKTYTKTCKYTFYKYSNPFSKLKIGKYTYTKSMDSPTLELEQSKLAGKLYLKLKSGYKLVNIRCIYGENMTQSKIIKNNSKLPANTRFIYITLQNTKLKINFTTCVRLLA